MVSKRVMGRGVVTLVLAILVAGMCSADLALVTEVRPPVTARQGVATWTPEAGETLGDGTFLDVAAGGLLKLVHLKLSREIILNGPKNTELQAHGLAGIAEKEFGVQTARIGADLDLSARSQQQVGAIDAHTAVNLAALPPADKAADEFDGERPSESAAEPLAEIDAAKREKEKKGNTLDVGNKSMDLFGELKTRSVQDEVAPQSIDEGGRAVSPPPPPAPAHAPAPGPVHSEPTLDSGNTSAYSSGVAKPQPSQPVPDVGGSAHGAQPRATLSSGGPAGAVIELKAALALPSELVMLKDGEVGLRSRDGKGVTAMMEVLPSSPASWTLLGIPGDFKLDRELMIPVKPAADGKPRHAILKPFGKPTAPLIGALEAEAQRHLAQAAAIWHRAVREGIVKPNVAQAHLKRLSDKMLRVRGDL